MSRSHLDIQAVDKSTAFLYIFCLRSTRKKNVGYLIIFLNHFQLCVTIYLLLQSIKLSWTNLFVNKVKIASREIKINKRNDLIYRKAILVII